MPWRLSATTSTAHFSNSELLRCKKLISIKKNRFGYYGSFGAGASLFAIGFCFVLFFFKEPKRQAPEPKDASKRSVVSLKNVANSFSVLVKEREGGMRHIVILLYTCFTVSKFWKHTLLMSTFSAGEPDIYWDGLPLLQKEVHMD